MATNDPIKADQAAVLPYSAEMQIMALAPSGSGWTFGRVPVDAIPGLGAGVNAFNNRTGNVLPQAGDYTADDIAGGAVNGIPTLAQMSQWDLGEANPAKATTADAVAGADDAKYMTAKSTLESITANAPAAAVASVFGRAGDVIAANGDYSAGQITFPPAGDIAATTVLGAIVELDAEKAPAVHTHNGLAPVGGNLGDALIKNSGTDHDYGWAPPGTVASTLVGGLVTLGMNPTAFPADQPVDPLQVRLQFAFAGQPVASQTAPPASTFGQTWRLKAGLSGQLFGRAAVAPTANADFTVKYWNAGGSSWDTLGVVRIAAGQTVPAVLSGFAADADVATDIIVEAPASPDATLENITIALLLERIVA